MNLVLDLDKTIWHTYDKHSNAIWAKQMIEPYNMICDTIVEDDVGSMCFLDNEIPQFLESIKNKIYFLSAGALWGKEDQPSIKLLKLFDIYKYFEGGLLSYKTLDKNEFLSSVGECVFVDDNEVCLEKASKLANVKVVNPNNFDSWLDLKHELD